LLSEFFLKREGERTGEKPKKLADDAMKVLQEYQWPGNVRELENVIERAYIEHVLRSEGGNKSRAAEVLGIDPSTLYRKIKRYQLDV
jgi:two-component system response regulator HydG